MPAISDLDIAVCFADLRGFTRFVDSLQSNSQDSRVHELLGSYFQIYPRAILETVYSLEPRPNEQITALDEKIRKAIVPTMFKTLGDGMMLVWELGGTRSIQDQVSGRILQVVATIRRLFKNLIKEGVENAAAPYSNAIANLELGVGLARGRAWRLDFGKGRPVDYAGTIVNIAARLQDLARPEGIVAEIGFCDPVFRAPRSKGQRIQVTLKGIVKPVDVWASPEVKLDS
jgi:class 3 adenylate cyclase